MWSLIILFFWWLGGGGGGGEEGDETLPDGGQSGSAGVPSSPGQSVNFRQRLVRTQNRHRLVNKPQDFQVSVIKNYTVINKDQQLLRQSTFLMCRLRTEPVQIKNFLLDLLCNLINYSDGIHFCCRTIMQFWWKNGAICLAISPSISLLVVLTACIALFSYLSNGTYEKPWNGCVCLKITRS